jgi:uncharacterized protein (DUF924 family)
MDRIEAILHYWFGHADGVAIPSEHRTWVWFSGDPAVDLEIKAQFYEDFVKAVRGDYSNWVDTPRGYLALIILFDQFSRHIYRQAAQAYDQDQRALDLCLKGIDVQYDHMLSLIERAFFYFPLVHAENAEMQALSIRAFEMLLSLSFPETRPVFERFLEHAVQEHKVVSRFGRFPQRNEALGRASTPSEVEFLKSLGG